MQYATLGSSGLIVSRLAFGAMTFTQGNSDIAALAKVDSTTADRLVGTALDAGVTLFDTADVYAGGESETLLGRALGRRRDNVVIATKVGFRAGPNLLQSGLSRRHILASADQSLQRLGTDWIDIYIAHCEDPLTPLEETLDALDTLVRSGKVRYLGFSNWPAWKAAAAIEMQRRSGLAPFCDGQVYYSLLGRDIERDLMPMAAHYGIGLTVWSPLAFGFLSGKYSRTDQAEAGNRIEEFNVLPFDKNSAFTVVDKVRAIAAEHQASVAQVALAWLLQRPGIASILLGASKEHQLIDNLGAADLLLTAGQMAELDTATSLSPVYPHWYQSSMADVAVSTVAKAPYSPGR